MRQKQKLSRLDIIVYLLAGIYIGGGTIVAQHTICGDFMNADQWFCRIGVATAFTSR